MKSMRNTGDKVYMKNVLAILFAVYTYLTYLDFIAANPEGKKYDSKGRELPCNPYPLSDSTKEAKEVYAMAQKIIWSDESEQKIYEFTERMDAAGTTSKALEWEKEKPSRLSKNPWRSK